MNVSPSSNSATNKTSSLLDTGSASSKVEETDDSKGFFESFKEALGFEESDSKATVKDTDDASILDEKQTSAEDEVSAEKAQGDSTESKIDDEASEAQTKQATAVTDVENTAELNSQSSDKASDDDILAAAQSQKALVNSDSDSQSAGLNAQGTSQASAAMSEGNKLLGQLDEAHKTLNQPGNGKGLPQQATVLLNQDPNVNSTPGDPTAIDFDNTDSSETKALAAAAQQISAQAASQSANNALTDKVAMLHGNNAHAAQQAVTQQLASQQGNAAPMQQQAVLDPNLTAQSLTINATPVATKAGSTDALLKAGAGAAALSGLGKAGAKDDSKDSTFAQQLASAAGAQGTATIGSAPTRAEIQAAQQAPLQLTKELANEQIEEKVQMMMSKNLKSLDIRLDPPELGHMKIRMTMNNDVANVHFTVSNQQAREVIEHTLPRLREMLAQQGLQLAESSVQQQSSGQGQDRHNNGEQQFSTNRTNNDQDDKNLDIVSNLKLNVASKRDGISYYA